MPSAQVSSLQYLSLRADAEPHVQYGAGELDGEPVEVAGGRGWRADYARAAGASSMGSTAMRSPMVLRMAVRLLREGFPSADNVR